MKKVILILSLIFLVGLVSFLIINDSNEETIYNEIELSESNSVINNKFPKFYDTIMSVGLDVAGVKGAMVIMNELSDEAKSTFGEGELRAHVRYFNGSFYLFTGEMSRSEALEVLSHEIVHIKQYLDGTFVYENDEVYWHGQLYSLDDVEYDIRPWEREAFSQESEISNGISKVLIK